MPLLGAQSAKAYPPASGEPGPTQTIKSIRGHVNSETNGGLNARK